MASEDFAGDFVLSTYSKNIVDPLAKLPYPDDAADLRDRAMELMSNRGIFTRKDHIDRYIAATTISQELVSLGHQPDNAWVNAGSTTDIRLARHFIFKSFSHM